MFSNHFKFLAFMLFILFQAAAVIVMTLSIPGRVHEIVNP